jgi:hypothetical protein
MIRAVTPTAAPRGSIIAQVTPNTLAQDEDAFVSLVGVWEVLWRIHAKKKYSEWKKSGFSSCNEMTTLKDVVAC